MRFTTTALSAMLSASALAYPGMGGDAGAFHKRMDVAAKEQKRAVGLPPALDAANSQVAQDIKACLDTTDSCEASDVQKV